MMMDPGSIPMDDPLAFFLTWTKYGSWLPGDERGWWKSPETSWQPIPRGNFRPPSECTNRNCRWTPSNANW